MKATRLSFLAKDALTEIGKPGRLTPGEEKLLESASGTGVAECSNGEVRAEVIRWLLTDNQSVASITPAGLKVVGARIVGQLNFKHMRIRQPLTFANCVISDGVDLTLAEVLGPLSFEGSDIDGSCKEAIKAEGIAVNGNFVLDRSKVKGTVTLRGGRIAGSLRCRGATLECGQGEALQANGIEVHGSLLFDEGFCCCGEIGLVGARIGGSVRLARGTLLGDFRAEFIQVGGSIICSRIGSPRQGQVEDGVAVVGEVQLRGARIEGNAAFTGGSFCNPNRLALCLNGAEIGGTVALAYGFIANGEVSLVGSRIGRNLRSRGDAKLCNPVGRALDAQGIAVVGSVHFENGFDSYGEVVFDGAKVEGELDCRGAKFRVEPAKPKKEDRDTWAFRAHGARIGGSVLMEEGFSACGGVSLASAWIGRNLRCCGGEFVAGDSKCVALKATTIEVEGNAKFDKGEYKNSPTTYNGLVTLGGATIRGDVDFRGARFAGEKSGVRAPNLLVTDCFYWSDATINASSMELDLTNARVGTLVDESKANKKSQWWENWPRGVSLQGFVYNALQGSFDYRERELWLARWSEKWPRWLAPSTSNTVKQRAWLGGLARLLKWLFGHPPLEWLPRAFKWIFINRASSIQPYQQLARVLRARGHEDAADRIMLKGNWAEVSAGFRARRSWLGVLRVAFLLAGLFFLSWSGCRYFRLGTLERAVPVYTRAGRPLLQHLLSAGALFLFATPLLLRPVRLLVLGVGAGFGYKRWLPIFWFGLLLAFNWGVFEHWAGHMVDASAVAEGHEEKRLPTNNDWSAPVERVSGQVGSVEQRSDLLQRPPDFSPFFYSLDALIFLFAPQNFGQIARYQPREPQYCLAGRQLRLLTRFDHIFGAVLLVLFVAAATGIMRKD